MSDGNGTAPVGTTTTHPPVGIVPRTGFGPASRKSVALADDAAAEVRRIDARLADLRQETAALTVERGKLATMIGAAGVEYGEEE